MVTFFRSSFSSFQKVLTMWTYTYYMLKSNNISKVSFEVSSKQILLYCDIVTNLWMSAFICISFYLALFLKNTFLNISRLKYYNSHKLLLNDALNFVSEEIKFDYNIYSDFFIFLIKTFIEILSNNFYSIIFMQNLCFKIQF